MKNKILLFGGLLLFIFGLIFNIRMFLYNCYPTYIFFLFCFVGIVQIVTACLYGRIKKWWQLFWILFPIAIWFIFLEIESSSKDIFLIPDGFRGKVTIQYEQKKGEEKEFEGFWWRIYNVPKSGILNTKFKIKGNSISYTNSKYFFVSRNGNRKAIKQFCEYCDEKDTTSVQMISGKLSENKYGEYQEFYIDVPKRKYQNE